jgi:hypothetical protein
MRVAFSALLAIAFGGFTGRVVAADEVGFVASRAEFYDLLLEPFATRAPDGSLHMGALFRTIFTQFPPPALRQSADAAFTQSPLWPDPNEELSSLCARQSVLGSFLPGHFAPKGEEVSGGADDAALLRSLSGDRGEGPDVSQEGSWKIKNKKESVWGSLELEVMLENLDGPSRDALGDRWQTKKALQVDVAGPLFAFGEFNAGYNTISAQEMKMSGGTGLGFKLASWENGEVAVKGGSQINYSQDPLRPTLIQNDKSRLVLGLECQYAIVGPLKLEYSGSAVPAMSALESNRISQDIRLLLPLGNNSQFRLGAKRNWSDQPALRAAPDANQVYFGIGITR